MLDALLGFAVELRRSGLPVSVAEAADAAEALEHIPLDDRQAVKYALGATLVKSSKHWLSFETAFEIYFSNRLPTPSVLPVEEQVEALGGDKSESGEGFEQFDGESAPSEAGDLGAMLLEALRRGDRALLRALAVIAVSRYAGIEPGRPGAAGTHYVFRTLRALRIDGALGLLMGEEPDSLGPLERQLLEEEYRFRAEELADLVEAEIRARLVAERGVEELASALRRPLVEDVDFMHASSEELARMQRAMAPLASKLRSRLARRREGRRRGPLDFRSTIRHSLAYGGTPADPRFRHRHPSKPEIFLIADISGSVAAFSRFTLQLLHAISSQFQKVRSFVFIDGLDEVTEIFRKSGSVTEALRRVNSEADVVFVDGHSDYGHALSVFQRRFGSDVSGRTSLVVLGDARSNYHSPEVGILKDLGHRARRLYWLNPEPRAYWGSGDSVIEQYAPFCDGVFECRNLRQLEAFVEQLA